MEQNLLPRHPHPTSPSPPQAHHRSRWVFSDETTWYPTGWAWYFGDEVYDQPWTQVTVVTKWSARDNHTNVVLSDGSIVLMGGFDGIHWNDFWSSIRV